MDDALMQRCIQNCQECHAACAALIGHCLSLGGDHAAPSHIGMLQDCAHICATSLGFMLRNSPRHPLTCGVCAQVCEACADECRGMAEGDSQMIECAETCSRCAESCRQMAHQG